MTYRHLTPLAAVLLLAAAGCGETRPATGSANDCSACHAFPPAGIAAHATAPGGTWEATDCAVCHGTSVDATGAVIPTSAGGTHANGQVESTGHAHYGDYDVDPDTDGDLHGADANAGLAACGSCHGATLDDEDGITGYSCDDCHATNGFATWQTDCTFCHGDATRPATPNELAKSAPPLDVADSPFTTDVGVGAHERHAVDFGYACITCHAALPTAALDAGHIDGANGSIQFGGLAVTGGLAPVWDRAEGARTCAVTYCHGGGFADGGGSNTTPIWTSVNAGQADCGDCHALPIPDPAHPQPFAGSTWLPADCSLCHGTSVNGSGQLLAAHLDGTTAAALNCTSCHSTFQTAPYHTRISAQATSPLDCSACHDPWRPLGHADGTIQLSAAVSCTSCHGTGDGAVQRNAAPPVDVYGGTDANRVGAHAAHLDGKTFSNGSNVSCGTCHSGAGSYTVAGHVDALDGTANVAFTGLGAGTVYETDRTCSSSYCHGNFPGGTGPSPAWSATVACGSCHPNPPTTGRHTIHLTTFGLTCGQCHTDYSSTAVNLADHVDGDKDVANYNPVSQKCTVCHHTEAYTKTWYP